MQVDAPDIFAPPQVVTNLAACNFYHAMELPELGLQHGHWDLRPGIDAYLSPVDFRGMKTLDIGTWDGYLAFEMERRGASVIGIDLGPEIEPDLIPSPHPNVERIRSITGPSHRHRANAFWLAHRLHRSSVRLVHAHAARLPTAVGPVDYCLIGNVLQHLADPLKALASAASLVTRGIIVTEANWNTSLDQDAPIMYLLTPQKIAQGHQEWPACWWQLTPGLVASWLEILGFEVTTRYEHRQLFELTGESVPHFTIVAERTRG
jgi:SAM-dependent methyltransferase